MLRVIGTDDFRHRIFDYRSTDKWRPARPLKRQLDG